MNLPTWITVLRILLIPVFVAIFMLNEFINYAFIISTIIFAIAAVTDFLDGYLARKLNQVTDLGKFLDAIADKMLVISALTVLIFGQTTKYFAPFVTIATIIILFREFFISGVRSIASTKGIVIAADFFGKVKTNFQLFAVIFLMVAPDIDTLYNKDIMLIIGFVFLAIATICTVLSGLNYVIKYKEVFKQK